MQLKHDVEATIWQENVFRLNESALDSLLRKLAESDFAILALTPDDLLASRGVATDAPRDNVVFELGLFMGALGPRRTFAVYDADRAIKLPSDLAGITLAKYAGTRSDKNLVAAVGEACDTIRDVIAEVGLRPGRANPYPAMRPSVSPRVPGKLVWVAGSYGGLTPDERRTTERLLVPVASAFAANGIRIVMGESDMLMEFAKRSLEASGGAAAGGTTTVLFGSLRQHDLREYFRDAVGAVPDLMLVLGGNSNRGRGVAEYEAGVTAGIPVLAVPATGGVAASIASTVPMTPDQKLALSDGSDYGDLSRTVITVVMDYLGSRGVGKPRLPNAKTPRAATGGLGQSPRRRTARDAK